MFYSFITDILTVQNKIFKNIIIIYKYLIISYINLVKNILILHLYVGVYVYYLYKRKRDESGKYG